MVRKRKKRKEKEKEEEKEEERGGKIKKMLKPSQTPWPKESAVKMNL